MNDIKFLKPLTFTALTITGVALFTSSVQAYTLFRDDNDLNDNDFTYSLTLEAGESLNTSPFPDSLNIDNLAGVNNVTTDNSIYTLLGFNTTSANFVVTTPVSSAPSIQTFNQIITITSDSNVLGDINYSGGFSGGSFNNIAQGPTTITTTTTTTTEFSPTVGLLVLGGIFSLNRWRKKLAANKILL